MSKVQHLAKLLKAVASQDWTAATASAAEIVNAEESKGHHSAAQLLRGALNPNQAVAHPNSKANGGWIGDPGFLSAALTRMPASTRLEDVSLRPSQQFKIASLIAEWEHRAGLEARGIERRRKLLFYGPPGCGKSLTAAALGAEFEIPTYVVRVDAVVGAFLGQTALRIRELFRFAENTPCILLLDEIDALGKRRGSIRDVGELDRVVIALMQELEHAVPEGVVIATSNVPEHLDEALFRRFDEVIEFPRPSQTEIIRYGLKRVSVAGIVPKRAVRNLLAGSKSYAEATRRIAARERALVLKELTT